MWERSIKQLELNITSQLCQKIMLNASFKIASNQQNEGPSATGNMPVQEDEAIVAATKTMKMLYYASILGGNFDQTLNDSHDGATGSNDHDDPLVKELKIDVLDCRKPLVNCEEFVNEPLNEQIEVGHDFTYFKNDAQGKFSFLKYNFILSTATKSMGLFYDNRVRMYSERRLTLLYSLLRGQHATPYLRLKVRRDHLIEDALVNVSIVVCTIKCLQYLSQNFWLMVCEVRLKFLKFTMNLAIALCSC